MNRRGPPLPAEALLYVLRLAGASILRGALLGWPPLNDAEAGQALVAAAEAGSIPAGRGGWAPPAPPAPPHSPPPPVCGPLPPSWETGPTDAPPGACGQLPGWA